MNVGQSCQASKTAFRSHCARPDVCAVGEVFCPNIQPRAHARLTGLTKGSHGPVSCYSDQSLHLTWYQVCTYARAARAKGSGQSKPEPFARRVHRGHQRSRARGTLTLKVNYFMRPCYAPLFPARTALALRLYHGLMHGPLFFAAREARAGKRGP